MSELEREGSCTVLSTRPSDEPSRVVVSGPSLSEKRELLRLKRVR